MAIDINDDRIVVATGSESFMKESIKPVYGLTIAECIANAKTIEIQQGFTVAKANALIDVIGNIKISQENAKTARSIDSIRWVLRISTNDGKIMEIGDIIDKNHFNIYGWAVWLTK